MSLAAASRWHYKTHARWEHSWFRQGALVLDASRPILTSPDWRPGNCVGGQQGMSMCATACPVADTLRYSFLAMVTNCQNSVVHEMNVRDGIVLKGLDFRTFSHIHVTNTQIVWIEWLSLNAWNKSEFLNVNEFFDVASLCATRTSIYADRSRVLLLCGSQRGPREGPLTPLLPREGLHIMSDARRMHRSNALGPGVS